MPQTASEHESVPTLPAPAPRELFADSRRVGAGLRNALDGEPFDDASSEAVGAAEGLAPPRSPDPSSSSTGRKRKRRRGGSRARRDDRRRGHRPGRRN